MRKRLPIVYLTPSEKSEKIEALSKKINANVIIMEAG